MSVGGGLRLRGDPRPRPHRRGADRDRRGEPGRARPRRDRHPRPLRGAARRARIPAADRALVERADARHVLVERAGDHERRRGDRHRALGPEGEARSACRSTTCSAGRPARGCASTATSPATRRRRSSRTRSAGASRASPRSASARSPRSTSSGLHTVGPAAHRSSRRSPRPRRCARALGDDVDLLLDAHTMFGPAEAAYLGHALEPYRLYFYEDPIRPLNPLSLRLVRDKVNLPIATGEQLAHKWEFQPLIENELVDYLRIDMVHAGGITEAKKILAAGRGARPALGPPPRELARQRRRLPARRPGGAELRHPGVDGARAALRALPERAARAGRLRRRRRPAPASASSSTRRRRAGARRATPPLPVALVARRRRRRLLSAVRSSRAPPPRRRSPAPGSPVRTATAAPGSGPMPYVSRGRQVADAAVRRHQDEERRAREAPAQLDLEDRVRLVRQRHEQRLAEPPRPERHPVRRGRRRARARRNSRRSAFSRSCGESGVALERLSTTPRSSLRASSTCGQHAPRGGRRAASCSGVARLVLPGAEVRARGDDPGVDEARAGRGEASIAAAAAWPSWRPFRSATAVSPT